MMIGAKEQAHFFSQRPEVFGFTTEDMELAWEEIDKENKYWEKEEESWENSLPNSAQRIEIFLNSGVKRDEMDNLKKIYLVSKFEQELKDYLSGRGEYPKKIVSEYNGRFGDSITEEQIDEARRTHVSKFIEVKKGYARCPFHNEKTPSFHVFKNLFNCFGCGEGGDTISFIQKTKDLDFKSAVRFILSYQQDKSQNF